MPRILEPDAEAIEEAVDALRRGRAVAFPTETVYGLGADTHNPMALRLIYAIKGRAADNPLIAHVRDEAEARTLAASWPEAAAALAERFWPGPLTLILPRRERVPPEASAGLPTIAIRSPRHSAARALLEAFGGPLSAPSANRSGRVSPTTASHVAADLADVDDLIILDGGRCDVGIESTVLDVTTDPPAVLRPGSVTVLELREIVPDIATPAVAGQTRSPGTRETHYAPRTEARLVTLSELSMELEEVGRPAAVLCFDAEQVPGPHRAIQMPQGTADYARRLYATLRQADDMPVDIILIEQPPLSNEVWRAVCNRLVRATRQRPDPPSRV